MTAEAASPRFSEAALAEYRDILTRYPQRRAALMPTLWLAQREFGWLSVPVLEYVAELMELPLAWVTSTASFYTMYWKEPVGKVHLQLCRNLPCALRGSRVMMKELEEHLGVHSGETTKDGRITLGHEECLGACAYAPMMRVDGVYHEGLDTAKAKQIVDGLE